MQDAELADRNVPPDVLLPWDSGPSIDADAGSVIMLPPSGQNITIGPWHHHNYVVYSEARGADQDVFLFDLASRQEITVVSEVVDQSWAYSPSEGGSVKSVYLHEISSGVTELILATVPGRQFQTSTWGDWVVWQDDRNGNWDIYAYQISTGLGGSSFGTGRVGTGGLLLCYNVSVAWRQA